MWEFSDYLPAPRPFYRRAWFILLALLLLLLVVAGVGGWMFLDQRYGSRAREFDFSKLNEMETASVAYDRQGAILGKFFVRNRETVSIKDLPPHLIKAVIAAEDNRFYEHQGVDYIGTARAFVKNLQASRKAQGGSTVTQQLARNTFEMFDKSYDRKFMEIFLAWEIEKRTSKQRILELYLNRVFFGASFYGVEAASQGYFGKPAGQLTLSESATLAGLLKNPNGLSPWSNRAACIESRNFVLGRMVEIKAITVEQRDAAIAENLAVKNRRPVVGQSYAMALVEKQTERLIGEEKLLSGGYRIFTTIDSPLQKRTEESMRLRLAEVETREGFEHQTFAEFDQLFKQWRKASREEPGEKPSPKQPDPQYLQGAVVVIDNTTGAILALVGGRDFAHSQYDRAQLTARPAGTAFTPLVFGAAFEKGMFPGTLVDDSIIDNRQVMIGGYTGILGEWGPESTDNKYEGQIPARKALVNSKNAATVRLGMETGIDTVLKFAKTAGIQSELRRFPATYLGSSEVTLMDMTMAFSAFAQNGVRPAEPFLIQRIEQTDGRVIFEAKPQTVRTMKESTAYEVHSCLAESLEIGTADKAFTKYGLKKFPVAGKTGTAYNFTDAWFVGYSSAITCGVWAGFDKPRTPIYRGAFSNQIALPIWVDIMNSSFSAYPPKEIPQPRTLKRIEICLKSGGLATDRCFESTPDPATGALNPQSTRYFEWGTDQQLPRFPCSVHGDGTVLASIPRIDPAAASEVTTSGQTAKAQVMSNLSDFQPVIMQGPVVVGADPYDSEQVAVVVAEPVDPGVLATPAGDAVTPQPKAVSSEPSVVRAEPVGALEQQPVEENPIKIEPPAPLEF